MVSLGCDNLEAAGLLLQCVAGRLSEFEEGGEVARALVAYSAIAAGAPDTTGVASNVLTAVASRADELSAWECAAVLEAGRKLRVGDADTATRLTAVLAGSSTDTWQIDGVAAALRGAHFMGCSAPPAGGYALMKWIGEHVEEADVATCEAVLQPMLDWLQPKDPMVAAFVGRVQDLRAELGEHVGLNSELAQALQAAGYHGLGEKGK